MKKISIFIALALCAAQAHADMHAVNEQIKLESEIVKGGTGESTLTTGNNQLSYHIEWPGEDSDTRQQQAMIKVMYEGVPVEDVAKIDVSLDKGSPIKVMPNTQGVVETWVFVPLTTKQVTLKHPKYGTTRIDLKKMKDRDVWSVPVYLEKLVNIQVKPLTDYNKPVLVHLVYADGHEESAMSPASFNDVPPGKYTLRFAVDGRNRDAEINVSLIKSIFSGENIPELDFRNYKSITFESTEAATEFRLDGQFIGKGTSFDAKVPYGPHKIEAFVNNNTKDEKSIDVNATSESIIYLSPIPTKTFEVIGMYKGAPVPTTIYVSGLDEERYNNTEYTNSHTFTLPVNSRPYTYTVFHYSKSGSKEIKVSQNMNARNEIKISSDRTLVWPWQRDYQASIGGWEFSFVEKQYSTTAHLYEDSDIKTTVKENGVWDDGYDHWLRGFRTGFHLNPAFKFGLGMYTGLFCEFYFSGNSYGIDGIFDKYFEFDLSIPLHVMYQFPLGNKVAIGFHTGPSFNWAAAGRYWDKFMPNETDDDNYEDWTDFWDEDWAPSRVNFTWDFGLFLRMGPCIVSGSVCRGFTDNKMHTSFGTDTRTVMNKRVLAFSISF